MLNIHSVNIFFSALINTYVNANNAATGVTYSKCSIEKPHSYAVSQETVENLISPFFLFIGI